MTDRNRKPAVPALSYLPPDPSVGELVTEIDRARHEAARTLDALVTKFDRPAVRTSLSLARPLGAAGLLVRRIPVPWWIVVTLLLLRWFRRRRHAR